MSTFKYDAAALALGSGQINLLTANVKAMLVSAGYGALRAVDQYVSAIPSQAIVARSLQLTSPAIKAGVFSALIPQFGSLLSTTVVAALVLYVDTGNDSTSPLLYYSSDGLGFPFLPIGINYFVAFDQANGGWFQI